MLPTFIAVAFLILSLIYAGASAAAGAVTGAAGSEA